MGGTTHSPEAFAIDLLWENQFDERSCTIPNSSGEYVYSQVSSRLMSARKRNTKLPANRQENDAGEVKEPEDTGVLGGALSRDDGGRLLPQKFPVRSQVVSGRIVTVSTVVVSPALSTCLDSTRASGSGATCDRGGRERHAYHRTGRDGQARLEITLPDHDELTEVRNLHHEGDV